MLKIVWSRTNHVLLFESGEEETQEEFNLPFDKKASDWLMDYLISNLDDAEVERVGEFSVGNYAHICPHASLSGNTQVGDSSTIGTGARVIPCITIGENCLIGAGAVVTRSVPNNKKAYGVPAKIVNYVFNFV